MRTEQTNNAGRDGEWDQASAKFATLLERTILANLELSSVARRKELAAAISPALERLDPEKARLFLEEAGRRLTGGMGGEKTDLAETKRQLEILAADNRKLRAQLDECQTRAELHAAAYDHLANLSRHFLQDEAQFQTKEQVGIFSDRVKQVLSLLHSSFRSLLKGRKTFQKKFHIYLDRFDPEITQVFRVGPEEFVWRRLLEWTKAEDTKDPLYQFAFVVDELKYHQAALLQGYENCIKEGTLNVIKELSPSELTKYLERKHLSLGLFKIPCRWLPWKKRLLYREFCRRYTDLVDEDLLHFKEKFDPFLVEGYVKLIKRSEIVRQISG